MSAEIVEATRENFHDLVAEGTVMVDVWGPDCQPCLALEPDVHRLADAHIDDLKVIKLEAPKARRLCMEMGMMGLPVFLLFRDGDEVARISGGDVTAAKLEAWLDQSLATSTSNGG